MSKGPLQSILEPFRQYARSAAYREFIQLLARYKNTTRYQEQQVRVLQYNLIVPDVLSFIFQFKDIFVEEHYRFSTHQSSPRILDCGANVGISCLYFKTLYPNARVTAFEADEKIASVLRKNLQRNGVQDVEIISKAVWTSNDGVEFASEGADGGSIFGSTHKINVPSIRLADVLDRETHIDFLKMDIEGAEVDVLSDCANVLHKIDRMYVEYHSWRNQAQHLDQLLLNLSNAGFRYYIQSVAETATPLAEDQKILSMDLQLHLFAVNTRLS